MRKLLSITMAAFAVAIVGFGSIFTLTHAITHTSSEKEKAFETYKEYLQQKDLKAEYRQDTYDDTFPSKEAYFAVAYIDDNDVPELLVRYTEDGSGGGTINAGQIRSYKDGKSHFVNTLGDYEGKTRIYEKTGIVLGVESDDMGGYNAIHYEFPKDGTSVMKAKSMLNYDSDTKKFAYSIDDKKVTAKEYESYAEKLTKGVKESKIEWHKNTEENRQQYLK